MRQLRAGVGKVQRGPRSADGVSPGKAEAALVIRSHAASTCVRIGKINERPDAS
jgi:hypothetical protein